MRPILYIITFVIAALTCYSCSDVWQEHIESDPQRATSVSELTVVQYLAQNETYADFANLLKGVGVDSLLNQGMQYTIWLPTAESISNLLTRNDSLRFARNHISLSAIYESKFDDSAMDVNLIVGKRVVLTRGSGGGYKIGDANIVKTNIICKDGVIHELDDMLVPMPNLYEKLQEPNYTALRNILSRYDHKVFSAELSTVTGIDEWGRPIYDSVFVMENKIFEVGDIRDENVNLTIFATPNDVLTARLEQLYTDYFNVTGEKATQSDTIRFEKWVAESLIFNGRILRYGEKEDLYSVNNSLWKCSRQGVNSAYIDCSNGVFYDVTKLHIPSILLMSPLSNNIMDMVDAYKTQAAHCVMNPRFKSEISPLGVGVTNVGFSPLGRAATGGVKTVMFRGIAGKDQGGALISDFNFSIYWNSFRKTDDTFQDAAVIPGEYTVTVYYSKITNLTKEDIDVYINNKLAGSIIGVNSQTQAAINELVLGAVNIEAAEGAENNVAPIEIKFKAKKVFAGTPEDLNQYIICPIGISLTPTLNNY